MCQLCGQSKRTICSVLNYTQCRQQCNTAVWFLMKITTCKTCTTEANTAGKRTPGHCASMCRAGPLSFFTFDDINNDGGVIFLYPRSDRQTDGGETERKSDKDSTREIPPLTCHFLFSTSRITRPHSHSLLPLFAIPPNG